MSKIIIDIKELETLIENYAQRHPLAAEIGADYVWQNDKAQEDAIQLVADIFDNAVDEDIE